MSLFKVRDFWSFDLDQLRAHLDDRSATSPIGSTSSPLDSDVGTTNGKAQFIVSVGQFSSIGEQDVFVCADLKGHIYIVQVPESDQRKLIKDDYKNTTQSEQTLAKPATRDGVGERQLLAATSLDMILVDLKCGFFTSALKQSIAALSSNKLIVLTVKRAQIDLLEEQLLSHELEVYIKLDLLINEFAFGVIVLNSHADACLVGSRKQTQIKTKNSNSTGVGNLLRASKQVVQQLHLPQRDKIVIQYANQFAFSLIDGKKIVGHFRIGTNSPIDLPAASESSQQPKQNQLNLNAEMLHNFGAMPMAHLITGQQTSASSLVISLSDHFIYCLPIDKLTSQARQNVVNRVALDLLSSNRADASSNVATANGRDVASAIQLTSGQRYASDSSIEINLDHSCNWQRELTSLPLQLQGLQRQLRGTTQQREQLSGALVGQLMVMSRYGLNLYTSSGDHLWHQRFETPLIYLHSYTIETVDHCDGTSTLANDIKKRDQSSKSTDEQRQVLRQDQTRPESGDQKVVKFNDHIVSLVCSDSLRDDRSSLMIMRDDQMSWSAMLNSRPLQVWRINLSQVSGLVAALDMRSGQLIASYLGTNMKQALDDDQIDSPEVANGQSATSRLVELERMNEPLFKESAWTFEHSKDEQRERLRVVNRIDLGSNDGVVNVCTSISLEPTSTSVIHNIRLTFQFDDLFSFELNNQASSQLVNRPACGVAEVQLGNCWPDRREALKIEASFSLASAHSIKLTGVAAMEQFNESTSNKQSELHLNNSKLIPKSLKVQQYLTFNETHSGTLHQEESFLLPISIVAKLKHVDYTSGNGQDLNDVLNNLAGYKRVANSDQSAYLNCDLFLTLRCDLFKLLHEFVEGDLICRGRSSTSNQSRSDGRMASNAGKDLGFGASGDELTIERKMETLESINLLAQSLDCRIRYMSPSPTGMARQPSEELVQPTMLSIALSLDNDYPDIPQLGDTSNQPDQDHDKTIWIHFCDLSRWEESDDIIADFIALHARGWKKFRQAHIIGHEPMGNTQQYKSKVLISVESCQPIAIVFVMQHLIERLSYLSATGPPTGDRLMQNLSSESLRESFLKDTSSRLAISSKLHDSLLSIATVYENEHKSKLNQLQLELSREFVNYRAVADNMLSFAKRLPNLPDNLSSQVDQLMTQAKVSHQRLMNILDELDRYKRRDFELTKLPAASMIDLELPKGSKLVPWPDFCGSFD